MGAFPTKIAEHAGSASYVKRKVCRLPLRIAAHPSGGSNAGDLKNEPPVSRSV
jgi:hypothetical protein